MIRPHVKDVQKSLCGLLYCNRNLATKSCTFLIGFRASSLLGFSGLFRKRNLYFMSEYKL